MSGRKSPGWPDPDVWAEFRIVIAEKFHLSRDR